ncbi:MAG: glycoside hydrolase family 16 protein [Flavobacteriaceae bacterium]|nr:glycoside hydrolase family 16 protein [Flavobacteriaceae bacterium]
MKKSFLNIANLLLLFLLVVSCKNTENSITTKKENLNSNSGSSIALGEDNYQQGSNWILEWSDEFKGNKINLDNWSFQVEKAGRFNNEWQRYTDSENNAYVKDDCMVIKAIHLSDKHGMDQYTSARMHTANKQSWKYGKIAARIKLPYGQGIWPAFWMLGANIDENGGDTPWPQTGEIDIIELYGSKDDGVIESNIHYADKFNKHASIGATAFKLNEGKFADAFHVFELEWDESKLSWFVDGEEFSTVDITGEELTEFHKEFFILLNIAVGGEYAGRPDKNSVFPQFMYIDWVRVYKKKTT